MAQQSLINWIFVELTSVWYNKKSSKEIYEKAIQMHKQEIIDASKRFANTLGVEDEDIEEYYNETYKK